MSVWYAVGIKIGSKADQMTVEAEDALIAALKVKSAHPEAAITYVRKQNARGDRRHPHASQSKEKAGRAGRRTQGYVNITRSAMASIVTTGQTPLRW